MPKYTCISADSHVVEPPNLWLDHIDPGYRERAPRVINDNGNDVFTVEGVDLLPIAGGSAANRSSQQMLRGSYEEVTFKGAYDPDERLKDQDTDGVQAEVVYPTIALRMFSIDDPDLLRACFRAYNDWIAQFVGAHPDRLKALALIPLDDMEAAVIELHRTRKLGLGAAVIGLHQETDDVQYDSPTYDPFWAAAQELEMPISMHVLTNRAKIPIRNAITKSTDVYWMERTLATMIFGGVFQRFPRVKAISAENDVGWVPFFMERMDYVFGKGMASQYPIGSGSEKPSDFFRRNIYCTFMRDRSGILAREQVGVEHMLWSSDYPHFDSTWPNSQKVIGDIFQGVPEEDKGKIIAGNAAKMYGFA